jgi:hypothetical protein
MYVGKLVFSQLMDFVPWRRFETCVRRYQGDRSIQSFPCAEHWRVMAFAQLTYRESLRDIEACLGAVRGKLYHLGLRGGVSRNNLSHANRRRDWRIYADFAQVLMAQARSLYANEELGIDLDATVYALDASLIDVCLSMFPWAKFRRYEGAIKVHALLNLRGCIPEFVLVSAGNLHDVNFLDQLTPAPGAYYVMDRGYLDFARLHKLHEAKAYFVTRPRKNFVFQRRYSREVDKATGVQCDQTILLKSFYSLQGYPEPLRRIRYYDQHHAQRLVFLTNDFQLPAATVAALYKSRWQIELFFKWIKQHLRIKAFYGTNPNAVKTQIWTAVSTYLLVAIIRKQLGIHLPLYTILQVLSVSLFEKTPLNELFSATEYKLQQPPDPNQLLLFE